MPKSQLQWIFQENNPGAIPRHGQTALAGDGWRKSRINTIKEARQFSFVLHVKCSLWRLRKQHD